MVEWRTYWDRPPMDRRTPLTVRGVHVFGHLAASGPVMGRPITLDLFLTAGIRNTTKGRVPTGVLTAGGLPAAEVTAWVDRFGIACAGRLIRPAALTASASLHGADPWPKWQIVGDAAHLIGVELDRSRPPLVAGLAAADARRSRAEARIAAVRREHALNRIDKARR